MSRKKKKNRQQQYPLTSSAVPASTVPVSPSVVQPQPTSDAVFQKITYDSLEDKIRGEEILTEQENRSAKEARDVKKKLDDSELDRRLADLRKQLGLSKK